jgi:hypothetical protein
MILNFTRGALSANKPRETISSTENDKYQYLTGTNRLLKSSQKSQQLVGSESTKIKVIWGTIFLVIIGLTIASVFFG